MTGKWQLYSQTGVDGPEYGVRIRPGYTVVGFQKEDAQQIVAWQNASIVSANALLTAEQREAIKRLIEPVECLLVDHDTDPEIEDAVKVLRGLLSGSKPAWEVTEERQDALKRAMLEVHLYDDSAVLRAMLEEAGK